MVAWIGNLECVWANTCCWSLHTRWLSAVSSGCTSYLYPTTLLAGIEEFLCTLQVALIHFINQILRADRATPHHFPSWKGFLLESVSFDTMNGDKSATLNDELT